VPCSGARRQNKALDEVSAAILGGVAAENGAVHLAQGLPEKFKKREKLFLSSISFSTARPLRSGETAGYIQSFG